MGTIVVFFYYNFLLILVYLLFRSDRLHNRRLKRRAIALQKKIPPKKTNSLHNRIPKRKVIALQNKIPKRKATLLFLLFFVAALIGLQNGDYIHYKDLVKEAASYNQTSLFENDVFMHMEPIYNILARFVGGNYLLWRSVVFGGAIVIIFSLVPRIGFNNYCFILYLVLIYTDGLIVGRLSWGVVLFFCSMVLLKQTNNYWYIFLLLASLMAHKCLLILVALVPLIFLKFNKKFIFLGAVGFFVLSSLLDIFFSDISVMNDMVEDSSRILSSYIEGDDVYISVFGRSLGEKIIYIPRFIAVFLVVIVMTRRIVFQKATVPNYMHALMITVSSLFLLAFTVSIGSYGDGTLAYRYLQISYFPCVFIISFSIVNKYLSRLLLRIVNGLLLFSFEMMLIVPFYYSTL